MSVVPPGDSEPSTVGQVRKFMAGTRRRVNKTWKSYATSCHHLFNCCKIINYSIPSNGRRTITKRGNWWKRCMIPSPRTYMAERIFHDQHATNNLHNPSLRMTLQSGRSHVVVYVTSSGEPKQRSRHLLSDRLGFRADRIVHLILSGPTNSPNIQH